MEKEFKNSVFIVRSSKELSEKGAVLFAKIAKKAVADRNRFMVALSGGSTPRKMHVLLGQEPYHSVIPWNQVHLFWGDERCVPMYSRWSNYGQAKEDFLDDINIPADNIHPMPGHLSPQEGASMYEKVIPMVFDVIFLGLGMDGHIASLFQVPDALDMQERLVVPMKGGNPDIFRLTMTFSLINYARNIVFLVSGEKKAQIVKSVLENHDNQVPATYIMPSGFLTWILDREAASLLIKKDLQSLVPLSTYCDTSLVPR